MKSKQKFIKMYKKIPKYLLRDPPIKPKPTQSAKYREGEITPTIYAGDLPPRIYYII